MPVRRTRRVPWPTSRLAAEQGTQRRSERRDVDDLARAACVPACTACTADTAGVLHSSDHRAGTLGDDSVGRTTTAAAAGSRGTTRTACATGTTGTSAFERTAPGTAGPTGLAGCTGTAVAALAAGSQRDVQTGERRRGVDEPQPDRTHARLAARAARGRSSPAGAASAAAGTSIILVAVVGAATAAAATTRTWHTEMAVGTGRTAGAARTRRSSSSGRTRRPGGSVHGGPTGEGADPRQTIRTGGSATPAGSANGRADRDARCTAQPRLGVAVAAEARPATGSVDHTPTRSSTTATRACATRTACASGTR